MTNAENRLAGLRLTEDFAFVGLQLGDQVARIIDTLHLSKAPVGITALHTPSAEDPKPIGVRVGGNTDQLDIFKQALKARDEAIKEGTLGRALDAVVVDAIFQQATIRGIQLQEKES
jgi:hypothetical protein